MLWSTVSKATLRSRSRGTEHMPSSARSLVTLSRAVSALWYFNFSKMLCWQDWFSDRVKGGDDEGQWSECINWWWMKWMDDWTKTLAGYGWVAGQICVAYISSVRLLLKFLILVKVLHCTLTWYDIQETSRVVFSREFLLWLKFHATFRRHFGNALKCRARL